MNYNDLETPQELWDFLDKNVKYGWSNTDGEKFIGTVPPKDML